MSRIGEQLLTDQYSQYPKSPGWKEPTTSRQAAPSKQPAATTRAKMLQAIKDSVFGLTADEASENVGVTPFTGRPRMAELNAMGLIKDSGARRKNPTSSKMAKVWSVV